MPDMEKTLLICCRLLRTQPARLQENKEARKLEAGFFLRERRYANLGHLLPMFPIGPAVKTRCIGPSSRHAI